MRSIRTSHRMAFSRCDLIGAIALLLCFYFGAARWITYEYFGSAAFRTVMALAPIFTAFFVFRSGNTIENPRTIAWLVGASSLGIVTTFFLPISPIKSIVFDESHGAWETVRGTFDQQVSGGPLTTAILCWQIMRNGS